MWRPDLPSELLLAGARQEPARFLWALFAIALGVALGFAILSINRHAKSEFVRAARDLAGEAHLTLRGPRVGFREEIYASIASHEDVAFASPALELEVQAVGIEEPVKLMGIDLFRAARVQPALLPVPAEYGESIDGLRDDRVFLSAGARGRWKLNVGETLQVQVGMKTVVLEIAGTLSAAQGTAMAVMDIAAAQVRFDRLGVINRIDVTLREGVDSELARVSISRLLPIGVHAFSAEQTQTSAARMARAYRVNLNVLALVALFTAALLVHATQSISVHKRAQQHALWRALGATTAQIRNALLIEAFIIGALGALLGVGAGWVAAKFAMQWVSGDLSGGANLATGLAFEFSLPMAGVMSACGVLAALAGALLPALHTKRIAVAGTLKGVENEDHAQSRARALLGAGLCACGAGLCFAPAVEGLPIFGYTAIVALLLGTIALLPRLAAALLNRVPQDFPLRVALPAAQLRGALRHLSLSLAATVAAVSVTVSMAIMVSSFRDSLSQWLDRMLPADLYVRAGQPNDTAYLDDRIQGVLRAMKEVRQVQFQRSQQIWLQPDRPRITLLARDRVGAALNESLPLVGASLPPESLPHPALWVSEIAQDLYGFKPGENVQIPIDGQPIPFTVAGVWRDYARQQGALLIERAHYVRLTADERVNEAAVWLSSAASLGALSEAIHAVSGEGRIEIAAPEQLRQISLRIFDRTFAVTYAMEAVAILIGLAALSSSLGALVLTRRREFGVLRHLGFTRAHVRGMLAIEGGMTTGVGLVVGIALGWVMSLILVHVINKQSFHWGMEMHIPWPSLIAFALALLALATLTSWWSARHAVGKDVVRAVKHDW